MNVNKPKKKFSVALQTVDYQTLIKNTLKDEGRANKFIADISSVVSNNPVLQDCEGKSVLSAAFLAESLKLSMSPSLGHCYLVPYDVAEKDANGKNIYLFDNKGKHVLDDNGRWAKQTVKKAQFQMGYKGYVQLAIRSGQYKRLKVLELKEGELTKWDEFNEEIKVRLIDNELIRSNTPTIGYYAEFECLNGFRKAIYWTKEKMLCHADKYSAAFSADVYIKMQNGGIPEDDMWKYSGFWYKNFDMMAKKTMLRQLIGKWGIMSIEFQTGLERDMAIINADGSYTYSDNPLGIDDDTPDNQPTITTTPAVVPPLEIPQPEPPQTAQSEIPMVNINDL